MQHKPYKKQEDRLLKQLSLYARVYQKRLRTLIAKESSLMSA
jgi:hypothetical protein